MSDNYEVALGAKGSLALPGKIMDELGWEKNKKVYVKYSDSALIVTDTKPDEKNPGTEIDATGSIVLQKGIMDEFVVRVKDVLVIKQVDGNTLQITAKKPRCAFCGAQGRLQPFDGKYVCYNCFISMSSD